MAKLVEALAQGIDAYGPVTVLIAAGLAVNGFFIWRDYRREERQQKAIDQLNRQHHEVVVPLLTECKEAIAACKEVIAQNSAIILSYLRGRNQ